MEKKYKHGFVFGKFMPVHKGHLHMIHTAEANCEELTILVCSLKSEPISGIARFMWMRELMPNAIVKHITDEVPQYPHEHPDFWQIWTKLLKDNIDPETDVVFTSENYGFEVAERLDIKHELVDIDRKIVPVSGTAIRKNPFENWSYIPDCVKPYFSKKFVFVGNECTGKTTISKQVTKYFNDRFNNSQWIGEYGREYCEHIQKPVLDEGDFKNIAWGQLHMMNQGIALGKKLNFIDTDLTVTEAYAKTYLGYCPELIVGLNYEI
jgi:HTH-type transcriptional regulator, transcriptional repressor of NAD biosynthesis genes